MRTIVNFNRKWAFSKQAQSVPAAIDPQWQFVNLPHTWNDIDGQDGDGDYYRGDGWYAKAFSKGELPEAKRYYLEIQGANSSAEVFLNGKSLAVHHGGYSTWRVELTDTLQPENLLVIRVSNAENDFVYPQMADFTFYGGLYRDVNILCVEESHFDLDFYGAPGVKVTPVMEGDDAHVTVQLYVRNKKPGQTIRCQLLDTEDAQVAMQEGEGDTFQFRLKNAHRWHGRHDPYLYTAKAELWQDGQVIDWALQRFGCRSFQIHPDRGFLLNGKEYPLRGVSRHQDRWGKGNALSRDDHVEDMNLICELGANTIRLAHYQHDQFFYDLCDERGMVVWAEIPYISRHLPNGRENTVSQMKELIYQNYNHPSIVVWGLSNEITIGGTSEALLENHRRLNELCHSLDSTRATAIAAVSMCPADDPYLHIPDAVSYNHYFGWYGGDTAMNGPWFDRFHAQHPTIPIGCSEYGCEGMNYHSSDPVQGDYTEEYQAHYHEELIRQLFTRPYLWATHVWNMFDFGADARNEGGEHGQNHKGLVTFDRRYKKDAFYAYKAWLSREPFVHLCGKGYQDRVEDVTKVTVYSNQPEVSLYANGALVETKRVPDHFFYFQVPNVGVTHLTAVAGQCRDESILRKVDTFQRAYRLEEKGAILNWFDITEKEGHLSLNSPLAEILAAPEGPKLMEKLLPREGSSVAGFTLSPQMLEMMGSFTVIRMVNMAGPMLGLEITREDLLKLNDALNQIPKP